MNPFAGQAVSLEQVMTLRERRVQRIQLLAQDNPHGTVVCFKLNIPGDIKTSKLLVHVFKEGVRAWERQAREQGIAISQISIVYRNAGDTYYCVVSPETSAEQVKQTLIGLEETHPLGRLFDFDTYPTLSRIELARNPRTCLLCDKPAALCARGQAHSLSELQQQIATLINTVLSI